jgi:ATP-binding cassette subfamily C protein
MAQAPRKNLVAIVALMIVNALTEGFGIMLLVPILTIAGQSGPSTSRFTGMLDRVGLADNLGGVLCVFVVLIALRALLQFMLQRAKIALDYTIVDGLRAASFSALMRVEWRWMAQERASDFSALLITNISRIGNGLTMAIETFATALIAMAYLATALILSWQTALIVGLGGAMVIIGFSGLRRRVTEVGHSYGIANRAVHQQVQEGVAAIRMTKLTGNEDQQTSAFAKVVDAVRVQQIAYTRQSAIGQSSLQVGGAALLAIIVYIGLEIWHVPIPILLPLLLVAMRLVPTLGALQSGWQYWLHALPALTELRQLMVDLDQNAEPEDAGLPLLPLNNAIAFDAVSLTYAGRTAPAVNNISLAIPANQTTAIIGASGAGKSSLADIMTGIVEPDSGSFTVDSTPIAGATRRRWRRSISYVQQDAFLFHTSVRENLLWSSPDTSEAELKAALTTAAADFVFALPDGLDTVVGDGGVRLSGGERQRIALARALLRSPALLILDEATSALDQANENAIRQAIDNLHGNLTIVLIGHRLAMLDKADQVVVLAKGQVIQQGTWRDVSKSVELAK